MGTDDVKRWVMSEIIKSRYDMPYVRADDHVAAMAHQAGELQAAMQEIEQLKTIKSFVMSSASSSQDDAEVVLLSQHNAAMKIQSQDLKSRWENQVHEMDGLIADRDRRIEELVDRCCALEDSLAERDIKISVLQVSSDYSDEQFREQLAEARKEIAELEAINGETRHERSDLRDAYEAVNEELAAIAKGWEK